MSEIQKCPNLVRGGGGVQIFQKCLKFKNIPNVGGGGEGSTLIGTLSQIFSFFFSDASPNNINNYNNNNQMRSNQYCQVNTK